MEPGTPSLQTLLVCNCQGSSVTHPVQPPAAAAVHASATGSSQAHGSLPLAVPIKLSYFS